MAVTSRPEPAPAPAIVLDVVRRPLISPKYGPVLITALLLVAMFVIGGIRYTGFASPQVVLNLLVDNAYLIVLAVGDDLRHPHRRHRPVGRCGGRPVDHDRRRDAGRLAGPPVVVIPLILVITSFLGLLVGLMIHVFGVQPFIATLAAMFLARGLCYLISNRSISIDDPFFVAMAQTRCPSVGSLTISPSAILAIVVVLIAFFVLHRTRFGRTVYALGGSESSALLMGLPVARTKVLVYVVSGFCSGLSGLLFSFYTLSGYSLTAIGSELDAIAAVVIGGTLLTGGFGFVWGSVLGVLVLGTIQTIITFEGTLSSWWTKIFIGGLLLVFIILQRLLTARRQ